MPCKLSTLIDNSSIYSFLSLPLHAETSHGSLICLHQSWFQSHEGLMSAISCFESAISKIKSICNTSLIQFSQIVDFQDQHYFHNNAKILFAFSTFLLLYNTGEFSTSYTMCDSMRDWMQTQKRESSYLLVSQTLKKFAKIKHSVTFLPSCLILENCYFH